MMLARVGNYDISDSSAVIIGVIVFGAVIAMIARLITVRRDPNKWYGRMNCIRCGYIWQTRLNTPPARCPRCSTTLITAIKG
jgi:hypothetical protein